MKKRALLFVLLAGMLLLPLATFGKHTKTSQPKTKKQQQVSKKKSESTPASDTNTFMLASVQSTMQTRALWVGDEAKSIVMDAQAQHAFFAFIAAPHGNAAARVNRVYLNAEVFDFTSKTQTKALRAFLTRAHQQGVAVEYLTGKPYWVKDASGYDSAIKRVNRMIAFNNGSSDMSARFDGIHYDIRPYLNSGWHSNTSGGSDEYNNAYEKNYIKILVGAKQKLTQSGQTLTLAVDVPTWFSAKATDIWQPLTAPNTPVSYIAVLNSFDTKDTFLYGYSGSNKTGGIGPNLARAGGVLLLFGGNTQDDESDALTFAEETAADMESVFAESVKTFGTHPQFKGVGVIRYSTYKSLASGAATVQPTAPEQVVPAPVPQPVSTTQPVSTPAPAPQPVPTPIPAPAPSTSFNHVRAMWIWGESDDIVFNSTAQNEFFSFAKAPHGDASARINRIFLSGDSFDYNSGSAKTALRAFLKKAHEQGIAVEFLTGNAKWAQSGQEYNAIQRCERMIAFNAGSTDPKERYDGMHLDIEPYLLAEWKTNTGAGSDAYNDEVQANYLKILAVCKQKIKDSGQQSTLSVDIPTWFAKASDIWNVITASTSPVDYITFMNYFDTEATFLYGYGGANTSGGIGPNLKQGGNIPMVFGAETINLEPTSITFFQEGFGAMEQVFDKAQTVYGGDPQFAGTAMHHYRTIKELKP